MLAVGDAVPRDPLTTEALRESARSLFVAPGDDDLRTRLTQGATGRSSGATVTRR